MACAFTTASGKSVSVSEKSLGHARRLLETCEPSIVCDTNPRGGDKDPPLPRVDLETSSEVSEPVCVADSIPPPFENKQVPLEGTLTFNKRGSQHNLDDKEIRVAVDKISSPTTNAVHQPVKFTSFSTASGKTVGVSGESLKHARKLFEGTDIQDSSGKLAECEGSRKPSETFRIPRKSSCLNNPIGCGVDGGAILSVKDIAESRQDRVLLNSHERPGRFSAPPVANASHLSAMKIPFSGFATASGKSVDICERSLRKAKELLRSCDSDGDVSVGINLTSEPLIEESLDYHDNSPSLMVASHKKTEAKVPVGCNSGMSYPGANIKGFQTASGKNLSISKAALERAEHILKSCEPNVSDSLLVGVSPAEKDAFKGGGHEPFCTDAALPDSGFRGPPFGNVNFESEKSLVQHAIQLSDKRDDSRVAEDVQSRGFTSETLIPPLSTPVIPPYVSKQNSTNQGSSLENVDQGPRIVEKIGFSTASGRSVNISEESLIRAKMLFKAFDEVELEGENGKLNGSKESSSQLDITEHVQMEGDRKEEAIGEGAVDSVKMGQCYTASNVSVADLGSLLDNKANASNNFERMVAEKLPMDNVQCSTEHKETATGGNESGMDTCDHEKYITVQETANCDQMINLMKNRPAVQTITDDTETNSYAKGDGVLPIEKRKQTPLRRSSRRFTFKSPICTKDSKNYKLVKSRSVFKTERNKEYSMRCKQPAIVPLPTISATKIPLRKLVLQTSCSSEFQHICAGLLHSFAGETPACFNLDRRYFKDMDLELENPSDLYHKFITNPCIDASLISDRWFFNHFTWITWKLIAMDLRLHSSSSARFFSHKNVINELILRYNREINHCERSCIRKILEADHSSSKPMVLFVSNISKPDPKTDPNCQAESCLELSDGWYSVKTVTDKAMSKLINRKKIFIGCKIITFCATMIGNKDGVCPLEDGHDKVKLQVHTNSTRRVRWYTKLGYFHGKKSLLSCVHTIYSDGGHISKLEGLVTRIYPLLFMETLENGVKVFRNERKEKKAQREYEEREFKLIERVQEESEKQFQQWSNFPLSQSDGLCVGSENSLSQVEKSVYDGQKRLEKMRVDMENFARSRISQMRQEQGLQPREVVPLLKIRLICPHSDTVMTSCVLTVWRPTPDLLESLQEGQVTTVSGVNVASQGPRQLGMWTEVLLNTTKQSRFFITPKEVASVRNFVSITELNNTNVSVPYNEVDVIGIVMYLQPFIRGFQNVFLSDDSGNFVSVRVWGGLSNTGIEDIVKLGRVVCIMDGQLRAEKDHGMPLVHVSDATDICLHPRLAAYKEECNRLTSHLQEDSKFEKRAASILELRLTAGNGDSCKRRPSSPILGRSKVSAFPGSRSFYDSPKVLALNDEENPNRKKIKLLEKKYPSPEKCNFIPLPVSTKLKSAFKVPKKCD